MKAQELIDKYVREEERDKVGVIAIDVDKEHGKEDKVFTYHVHRDEELPTSVSIAIRVPKAS